MPPSSVPRNNTTPPRSSGFGGDYEEESGGGLGGEGGGFDRGSSAGSGVGIDDPLARARQQEYQEHQQRSSTTPPRWQEEPEPTAGEVPSWLGKSSLGSSRRTTVATPTRATASAGNPSSPLAEQHPEDFEEDAGGVWGDEATDWSNSGSVV